MEWSGQKIHAVLSCQPTGSGSVRVSCDCDDGLTPERTDRLKAFPDPERKRFLNHLFGFAGMRGEEVRRDGTQEALDIQGALLLSRYWTKQHPWISSLCLEALIITSLSSDPCLPCLIIMQDHERAYFDSADWVLGKVRQRSGGGKKKHSLQNSGTGQRV